MTYKYITMTTFSDWFFFWERGDEVETKSKVILDFRFFLAHQHIFLPEYMFWVASAVVRF